MQDKAKQPDVEVLEEMAGEEAQYYNENLKLRREISALLGTINVLVFTVRTQSLNVEKTLSLLRKTYNDLEDERAYTLEPSEKEATEDDG